MNFKFTIHVSLFVLGIRSGCVDVKQGVEMTIGVPRDLSLGKIYLVTADVGWFLVFKKKTTLTNQRSER